MTRTIRRHQFLWCVATDRTFERVVREGRVEWIGKCIHCRRRVIVASDGTPRSPISIEHIVPKAQGGTDAIENLAIACIRCNGAKGRHHDHKSLDDPGLSSVIATLRARREERYRSPPDDVALPEPI